MTEEHIVLNTHKTRKHNNPRPYPICGATNREGFHCGQPAGKGTDHLGIGRCKFHGGMQQTVQSIVRKNGIGDALAFPGIQEEFDRLQKNGDVFDLRDHIHLIEAIALTVMKSAKTVDDLPLVAKLIRDASKTVRELDEIEHARRLVIELPELRMLLEQIKIIIFRHVQDTYTRNLIGEDIRALPAGGTSFGDSSGDERSTVVEGLAVESGLGLGEKD